MSTPTVTLTDQDRARLHTFGQRIVETMRNRGALPAHAPDPRFYATGLPDRAVLALDLASFQGREEAVTNAAFLRQLRAALEGRRVVITNGRGLVYQVGWAPTPTSGIPDYAELNLASAPSSGRLLVPLGETAQGPCWLSLLEMDSVLLGGTRRLGKTTLLHAFILALVAREPARRVRLLLADGKDGVEFGVYRGLPHVQTVTGTGEELAAALGTLRTELHRRSELLVKQGARKIADLPSEQRPPYLVLVVDELAYHLETPGVDELLRDLVARGGAYGIHPVLATQRPDASVVKGFLKTNLATRIALPVPDRQDSQVILGRNGAEQLPKIPGRVLFTWRGRRIEAQGYAVSDALLGEIVGRLEAQQPPLSGSAPGQLTPAERQWVTLALEQFEGYFSAAEVAAAANASRRQVSAVAQRWELQGLLEPATWEDGVKLPRRITAHLKTLATSVF